MNRYSARVERLSDIHHLENDLLWNELHMQQPHSVETFSNAMRSYLATSGTHLMRKTTDMSHSSQAENAQLTFHMLGATSCW